MHARPSLARAMQAALEECSEAVDAASDELDVGTKQILSNLDNRSLDESAANARKRAATVVVVSNLIDFAVGARARTAPAAHPGWVLLLVLLELLSARDLGCD